MRAAGIAGIAFATVVLAACCCAVAVVLLKRRGEDVRRTCDAVYGGLFSKPHMFDGVLTADECAFIVREAERHAATSGGWLVDRHKEYPTTDLDVATVPALRSFVDTVVRRRVFAKIERAYGLRPGLLGINEVFVAKYADDDQRSLDKHTDESEFSFVIALNDAFDGGGTFFGNDRTLARGSTGSLVVFNGQTPHEGLTVTRGTRYVLVGFLNVGGGTTSACKFAVNRKVD